MDWFLYDNGLRHERVKQNFKFFDQIGPNSVSHQSIQHIQIRLGNKCQLNKQLNEQF